MRLIGSFWGVLVHLICHILKAIFDGIDQDDTAQLIDQTWAENERSS